MKLVKLGQLVSKGESQGTDGHTERISGEETKRVDVHLLAT